MISTLVRLFRVRGFAVRVALVCFAFSSLPACGGGGGGDDGFAGSGRIGVSVEPGNIDVGDRTRVRVDIFDVNEDGIIIKVLVPDALEYVEETGVLEVDGDDTELEPDVLAPGDDDDQYIVFFLSEDLFNSDGHGVLEFEMQAMNSINNGEISVDIDVDNPAIKNPGEFDPSNPQFQEEDSASIQIVK
ncbi:MAG: hypothetical protein KDD60_01480 [Bdellovibrionales bacterium]|nr:hypothetical protein [Bdellovibrionales bacterium]